MNQLLKLPVGMFPRTSHLSWPLPRTLTQLPGCWHVSTPTCLLHSATRFNLCLHSATRFSFCLYYATRFGMCFNSATKIRVSSLLQENLFSEINLKQILKLPFYATIISAHFTHFVKTNVSISM